MSKLDKEFWNNRYLEGTTGWDVGYPTTPLKEYFTQLKDKQIKVLIPGAGNAYEAEYLHRQGFKNVYVLDVSDIALSNFKNRVQDFPSDHLICEDFFHHRNQYDLIIEQTFFCALDPSLRPKYAEHIFYLLKPGGRLVGLLFDDKLNEDKPPYGGTKAEYVEYFKPYFEFHTFETSYNSIKPRAGRELFINLKKSALLA